MRKSHTAVTKHGVRDNAVNRHHQNWARSIRAATKRTQPTSHKWTHPHRHTHTITPPSSALPQITHQSIMDFELSDWIDNKIFTCTFFFCQFCRTEHKGFFLILAVCAGILGFCSYQNSMAENKNELANVWGFTSRRLLRCLINKGNMLCWSASKTEGVG